MSTRPPSDAEDPIVAMLEYTKSARRGGQFDLEQALRELPEVYTDAVTSRYACPTPLHVVYADAMKDVVDLAGDREYVEGLKLRQLREPALEIGRAGARLHRPDRDTGFVANALLFDTSVIPRRESRDDLRGDLESARSELEEAVSDLL